METTWVAKQFVKRCQVNILQIHSLHVPLGKNGNEWLANWICMNWHRQTKMAKQMKRVARVHGIETAF